MRLFHSQVDAEVTNIVATDVARRRMRQLLANKVDVSFTLVMVIDEGSTAAASFQVLKDDLVKPKTKDIQISCGNGNTSSHSLRL